MSGSESTEEPKGVTPHIFFGGEWRTYPRHRWYAGVAWHYTTVEGCFGIVSNNELWGTASTMLNDVGEMSYGVSRIQEVVSTWVPSQGAGSPAETLLRDAVSELEAFLVATPLFVISASTSPELLNQWANYGESSGCAIGIDTMVLLMPEGMDGHPGRFSTLPLWLTVIYDAKEQEEHIRAVLDELVAPEGMLSAAIVHDMEPRTLAAQNLAMLFASLKHPGFAAEREVRLVAGRQPETVVRYRPSPRGIMPYVRFLGTVSTESEGVQGSNNPDVKLPLPLTGVRVGPPQGDSEQRRIASMRDFLRAHGYEIEVAGAGIPYLP